jgi:hypothetical protein
VAAAGKAEDQLREQMDSSIRMETEDESPARTPGGQRFSNPALSQFDFIQSGE